MGETLRKNTKSHLDELELFWSKGHCQQGSRQPPPHGGGFYPFAPEESSQNMSAWNPV
jgi:hypothetical protein